MFSGKFKCRGFTGRPVRRGGAQFSLCGCSGAVRVREWPSLLTTLQSGRRLLSYVPFASMLAVPHKLKTGPALLKKFLVGLLQDFNLCGGGRELIIRASLIGRAVCKAVTSDRGLASHS